MATVVQTRLLAHHWGQVIKEIYPTITVNVKGDANTVDGLLSVWDTGDSAFPAPTEVELLAALEVVLIRHAKANAVRAGIVAQVEQSSGKTVTELLEDNAAKGNLLLALLLATNALDVDGRLRPANEWLGIGGE